MLGSDRPMGDTLRKFGQGCSFEDSFQSTQKYDKLKISNPQHFWFQKLVSF